jgi:hypothetical protein
MPYRVTCHLVLARDQKGLVHHRYDGEIIEWLSDEQRSQWLADGLVEELGAPQIEAIDLAEQRRRLQADEAEAERVRICVDALNELDVPLSKGRPAVRAALEARGLRFSNETIAAALKERRELSGKQIPGMPAWPVSTDA